jgi:ectoine hydroxylase-related dioxygenase (phytanoyl-CoA dioxygenase family)
VHLSQAQRAAYREAGHLTVPGVFTADEIAATLADLDAWAAAFLADLRPEQRAWYLDRGVAGEAAVLRKLDNPHHNRAAFGGLARDPRLVGLVEDLIGPGVTLLFSQVFMKPPHGGGPKPVHQDNFYFGPADPEGLVTAWLALDPATLENGCLQFGEGSNRGPVLDHVAPPEQPYDLQVRPDLAAGHAMTPAPVPAGGVSFHHGSTLHQSADNRSDRPRRACAFHYMRNDNRLDRPALPYDETAFLRIT